jgi:DNA (cytosine-5)-methyltransferase 1
MRALSLFSGCGGMDLGFHNAGIKADAFCEIDKQASSVLRRHWPATTIFSDVREVTADVLGFRPDIVHGGFPCQDVSVAGRRQGLDGERSGLWWEFHRIIAEVSPEWVVIENVAGLLSSNGGRDLGAVVGALGELGYGWAYRVLDARYFGVAQRRRRVFIVGHLGSRRAAEILLEPEGMCGNTSPRYASRTDTSADAGGGTYLPSRDVVSSWTASSCQTDDESPIAGHLIAFGWQENRLAGQTWTDEVPALTTSKTYAVAYDQYDDTAGYDDIHHSLRAGTKQSTGVVVRQTFVKSRRAQSDTDDETWKSDGPAPRLNAFDNGSESRATVLATADLAVRRLTPTECERLMGWPDGWTAEGIDANGNHLSIADSHRYRLCGNGVVAPVAEWIGRRIVMTVRPGHRAGCPTAVGGTNPETENR